MVRKLCHGLCNICKHYLPTEQGLKVSFAGMFPPRETVLAVHVGKRKEKRTTDWWCITHSVLDNEWGQSRIPDKADCCCVFSHTCKVPTNYDLSRWRGVTVNTFLMLLTHTHTHTHTYRGAQCNAAMKDTLVVDPVICRVLWLHSHPINRPSAGPRPCPLSQDNGEMEG